MGVRPVTGFGLTGCFGEESTWGTAVSTTANVLRLTSFRPGRKIQREKIPHLGSYGQASAAYRYHYDAREVSTGRFEWVPGYSDSTMMLLRHMFGTVTDAGSGPSSYTHAYTLVTPPDPAGLTAEFIRGTHPSLATAQVFEGTRFGSWDMSWEQAKPALWGCDYIAETASAIQAASAATPSYTTTPRDVLHNHMGAFSFASATPDLRKIKVMVNRNLSPNQQLGSLLTAEPVPGRIDVTVEAEVLWNAVVWDTAHYAGTQGNLTFSLTDGTRTMAFTVHNAMVDDVDTPTPSAEGLVQNIKLTAYAGASDQGLALTVTNGNQLYTAN